MNHEPNTTDILVAISDLSSHVDEQFVHFEQKLKQEIKQEITQSEHSDIFKRLEKRYQQEK